jgi:hypothetical protein
MRDNIWFIAAIWMALALIASFISTPGIGVSPPHRDKRAWQRL